MADEKRRTLKAARGRPSRREKGVPSRGEAGGLAFEESPEARRLSKAQVEFLAAESGVPGAELRDLTLGTLVDRLKFRLDPKLFFFQRVCGRVVRRDPITHELHPVPRATVHVDDTDCNFVFYSPNGTGFTWLYPLFCPTEEIAAVQTDDCGYFCVYIPRWDIDRILRWRRERICLPTIERPRIIDLIGDLLPDPGPIITRPPIPDPPPDFFDVDVRRVVESRLGPKIAQRLALSAPAQTFGAFRGNLDSLLSEPVPQEMLPKPLTPDPTEVARLVGDDSPLTKIDLGRPIGPFRICYDLLVPEWQTIVDVPDITFRVTQMQAGGEVTIYSEGFFDVRWDDTSIPDVTLEAGPNAQSVAICQGPIVQCQNSPAILTVELMPITAAYHDDTIGFGTRTNQKSSDGISPPVPGAASGTAHAPYADRLDLFGCFHIPGATHYRVLASLAGAAPQPVLSGRLTLMTSAGVVYQDQLAGGWYPVRNDLISVFEHYILDWLPTHDGTWDISLELGAESGGAINPIGAASPQHKFEVDGSYPTAQFSLRWWYEDTGPGSATVLPVVCPVINRQPTRNVVVEVAWSASAAHLREASVGMGGCGGGAPVQVTGPGTTHWYWQNTTDTTTGAKLALFRIPTGSLPGCYTVSAFAASRAYNPMVPGSSLADEWYVAENRRYVTPSQAVSVVNA
jgi:hypothetical protein